MDIQKISTISGQLEAALLGLHAGLSSNGDGTYNISKHDLLRIMGQINYSRNAILGKPDKRYTPVKEHFIFKHSD